MLNFVRRKGRHNNTMEQANPCSSGPPAQYMIVPFPPDMLSITNVVAARMSGNGNLKMSLASR